MKVLLVDDESYIVEYLKHLIRWEDYGFFEVIGYSGALEAKMRLEKGDIDLLVSDISMPEISGIDLLKFIREEKLITETIFLSSYSEFEYAQQAIRYGLAEYLLKPITKENLEKALTRVLEHLDAQEEEVAEPEQILFSQLPAFDMDHAKLSESLYCFVRQKGPIPHEKEKINRMICLNEKTDAHLEYSNEFSGNDKRTLQFEFYCFFYQIDIENAAFQKLQRLIHTYFQKLINQVKPENNFRDLFVKLKEKEKIYFLVNLTVFLIFYVDKNIREIIDVFHLDQSSMQTRLLELFEEYYTREFQDFSAENMIRNTNQYILENLEKDLSLDRLAHRAYLNPAYFSTVYKQETGINLSVYIQERRLEQAVKFLKETSLKVSDIGKMVGYPHTQYFTKIFKERYGMTPNRYRKRNMN